ncbi:hypothetical protein [Anaeromyxobacter sp. Fw109-5]|uniref:hypothetical protein n=1 Tax=Anaeromyxobacter sp. (strain Fw109-5) TaxID=404589 RepID=UPI0000ED748E|nr:hypothetical protein [Anaeromyxobacter sp. Fw109-5]ABS26543.1 conserved hypothetical protein [Anaeromyxobacter sp. Fw109-5]
MPRPPPLADPSVSSDEPLTDDLHGLPPELDDEEFDVIDGPGGELPTGDEPLRGRMPRRTVLLAVLAAAAVTLVAGSLVGYRLHHRRAVLREGLARAGDLLVLDTSAGYRDAASLLEPLAELDPLEAGGTRAFALAMLATDYRDDGAARAAAAQLVEPMRAPEAPPLAHAATAALALGRREAGNAMTAATRAGANLEASVLAARVALQAGNLAAAEEPLAAAAAAGRPAALALRGDVLRRTRRDLGQARASYAAALSASPLHPRASYGLAKLALSGHATPAEAESALRRLLADRERTPAPERGRAALHLAALHLRAGDRAGAHKALDGAGLDRAARTWAERAAAVSAAQRGSYRAVEGAPAGIRSASDDDPPLLAAIAPAPPRPAPAAAPRPVVKKQAKVAASRTKAKASAKRPSVKPSGSRSTQKQPAAAPSRRKATAAKRPSTGASSTRR